MTSDQVKAVGRVALGFAGGVLVSKGMLSGEQLNALANAVPGLVDAVGALLPLVAAIWAAWRNSPQQQLNAVAARPDVAVIGTTEIVALNTPNSKVIPASNVRQTP